VNCIMIFLSEFTSSLVIYTIIKAPLLLLHAKSLTLFYWRRSKMEQRCQMDFADYLIDTKLCW